MISVQSRQFQQIAVLGLGTSGLATARALLSGGAEVSVWDDDPNARKEALNENIALANPATIDWAGQDALVLSPGVPLTHPTPHPRQRQLELQETCNWRYRTPFRECE